MLRDQERGDNKDIEVSSFQVFSIRLGRMVYISAGDVLDDSIIEDVFPDRKNWYPYLIKICYMF